MNPNARNIGLKRGTVKLETHSRLWDEAAGETILCLREVLGSAAVDIQHVGSTAIKNIKAKPIIDIAVGMRTEDDVMPYKEKLEEREIIYRGRDIEGQILFVMGDFEADTRTHHIHIVKYGSKAWNDYIAFRDYLNNNPAAARQYEMLKLSLCEKCENDRDRYTKAKADFIARVVKEAENTAL